MLQPFLGALQVWHLTLVDVASCTWDPPTQGVGDLSSGYPRHDGPARGKHGYSACASSNIFKHEIECETIFNHLQPFRKNIQSCPHSHTSSIQKYKEALAYSLHPQILPLFQSSSQHPRETMASTLPNPSIEAPEMSLPRRRPAPALPGTPKWSEMMPNWTSMNILFTSVRNRDPRVQVGLSSTLLRCSKFRKIVWN